MSSCQGRLRAKWFDLCWFMLNTSFVRIGAGTYTTDSCVVFVGLLVSLLCAVGLGGFANISLRLMPSTKCVIDVMIKRGFRVPKTRDCHLPERR